ncbi:MAG TPA: tetratricopeptide repeat protein [Sphingomicrobium sp.]
MRLGRLLAAATAAVASAASAASPQGGAYEIQETIRTIAPDGWSWFESESGGMRFVVEPKRLGDTARLADLLDGARTQGRSVRIRFTAVHARFDPTSGKATYPLCSVQIEETRVEIGRSCPDRIAVAKGGLVERLTVARAEIAAGSPRPAVETLSAALADPKLSPELKLFALRSRTAAYRSIADREKPGSEAADLALVRTLSDVREIARLNPDSAGPQASIAYLLQELGDYDGARRTFEQILAKWPERKINPTIDLAAILRNQGDNQAALDLINSLVADHSPADLGMRFYYHRGWTLLELRRFDEAIADFSEGLRSQPDYPGAFMLRACAYASVGNLPFALSDVETAGRLLRRLPQEADNGLVAADVRRADEIAAQLRTQIPVDGSKPFPAACEGYADWPIRPRLKSRLLEAAGR